MVEMQVAGIALDAASRSPIVLLRDPSGRRQVPIWIDQAQAQNIMAGLDGRRPIRPLSHDLMVDLLEAGDLHLERVIIHAIEDNTFRAVLKLLQGSGEALELDARPSDAIALALRCGSGIWMLEEVVGDASIPVDAEADAEEKADFRRFLERTSPAELIRHLGKGSAEAGGAALAEDAGDSEPFGETGAAGASPGTDQEPRGAADSPSSVPSSPQAPQPEHGMPTPPESPGASAAEPPEGPPGGAEPHRDD
jgi:bifunctional DNase/RNase